MYKAFDINRTGSNFDQIPKNTLTRYCIESRKQITSKNSSFPQWFDHPQIYVLDGHPSLPILQEVPLKTNGLAIHSRMVVDIGICTGISNILHANLVF